MFFSMWIFRTSSWEAASQVTLRELLWGGKGAKLGYRGVMQPRAGIRNIKILLLIRKKNRYPKLRNLTLLYVWEDAKDWAHWNHAFDIHLSYLGTVSCNFTSWAFSGLTFGSGCSLTAASPWVFFLPWVSPRLTSSPSAVAAVAMTPFVHWYSRKYFISHPCETSCGMLPIL